VQWFVEVAFQLGVVPGVERVFGVAGNIGQLGVVTVSHSVVLVGFVLRRVQAVAFRRFEPFLLGSGVQAWLVVLVPV
jgi:hypothetical protein